MALLRKLRNLKASILSSSLCKGDCTRRGLMSFYDEEKICPLFTRAASAAVSGSISSAVCHSSSRRSYRYSFSAMSWSSRIEAAGQKFSRFRLIGHQSLLPRDDFSRAFAIYAIHCILRYGRYNSFRVATVWSGSNIGKLPKAGLNLLADQSLGGVCSRKERTIAPKQAADVHSRQALNFLDATGSAVLKTYQGLLTSKDSFYTCTCFSMGDGVQHTNLRLLSGACCLPHPNKSKTGGEDAFFICSEEQVVGVADGVGGWADVGIDAGNYARELMLQSKRAVAQEPHGYINPARVLMRAHAKTKCRGSSTACIIGLSDHGIQAANLGDSGFILIRNGRSIFKSPVQQHQFNIPFQLESGGSDPPSSAEVFALQVAAGDVLVAGTDGLFDNLYDSELMGIVIHSTRAGLVPQVTAQKIAALARLRAEDCNRQTPFSTAAQEAGFRFYGGKMDDITVIVSYVSTS